VPEIELAAQAYISKLPFPGNVRELENMLERALALCDGKTITTEDLLHEGMVQMAPNTSSFAGFAVNNDSISNLPDYLEQIEKEAILNALSKTNNNKTAAAKLLGVSFRTLRYRLAKLGITKESDADLDSENDETQAD
jgi:two-component system response regulator PilR (NtrC family)